MWACREQQPSKKAQESNTPYSVSLALAGGPAWKLQSDSLEMTNDGCLPHSAALSRPLPIRVCLPPASASRKPQSNKAPELQSPPAHRVCRPCIQLASVWPPRSLLQVVLVQPAPAQPGRSFSCLALPSRPATALAGLSFPAPRPLHRTAPHRPPAQSPSFLAALCSFTGSPSRPAPAKLATAAAAPNPLPQPPPSQVATNALPSSNHLIFSPDANGAGIPVADFRRGGNNKKEK